MDRILGHKPTTVPESIVDSLAQIQGNNDSSPEITAVNEVDKTLFGDISTSASTSSTSTSTEVSSIAQQGKPCKRRKDRGKINLKVMNKIMEELISSQERNEARYLELEEKTMGMEEKIYNKEVEM